MVISFAINLRQTIRIATGKELLGCGLNNMVPYKGDKEFLHKIFTEFGIGGFHHVRFDSTSEALLESGLGASAAGAVATVGAINRALKLNMTKGEVALKAWEIEVEKIGLYGGKQDQFASAFGGVNAITFSDLQVEVNPILPNFTINVEPYLVLLHTGSNRKSPIIQESFKQLDLGQIEYLDNIKDIAEQSLKPLSDGDMEKVGDLLNKSYENKKKSNSKSTTPRIDKLFIKAKKYGSLGGKICGAGGGGFMVHLVEPDKRQSFIENMENEACDWWDFSLDYNGLETRVL